MDKRNFDKMIKMFSEVFEKDLNPYVIKIYYDLFKEIPDSQAEVVTKSCLRKCKYFPRPADVFEQLSETPEKYVYKPDPILTKDEIEKNKAEAKAIKEKLKGKLNIL